MKPILREITNAQLQKRAEFKVGDGVKVHTRVREGEKERIQIFGGVVISKRGTGIEEMFTVRRIASGVGVERVFPLHSPNIEKIEVDRDSVVGRARMYYIRDRIGKAATKVNEKRLLEIMGAKVEETPETKAAAEAKVAAKVAEKAAKADKKAAAISAKTEKKAAKVAPNADKKAEKSDKKADKKEDKKADKKDDKKAAKK